MQKPVEMVADEWILVYQKPSRPNGRLRSNYNAADKVYKDFIEAQRMLGMRISEPYWIELENEGDTAEFEQKL